MAIVINGSGTVTGISVGGLPDGIVDAGTLATNSVDSAELIDGAVDNSHLADDAVNSDEIAAGAIDAAHLASGVGGITVAANWRQNDNTGISIGTRLLTAKWEQNDQTGAGSIGSALTESGGVFTFPVTGIYYITFSLYATLENDETALQSHINVTTNNDSYSVAAIGSVGIQRSSGNYQMSSIAQTIFDVTDTANCKVRFGYDAGVAPAESEIKGDTNYNQTNFMVIRLGDT